MVCAGMHGPFVLWEHHGGYCADKSDATMSVPLSN